ncbi:MAG: chloramphenicol acetyltransferase [Actinomycetota bacterium]
MRTIDLEMWPRRNHFEMFQGWHDPRFDMCANVDLTVFRPAVKQKGASFTIALVYVLARAANDIPEFRMRIRGESVIEHEIVHPGSTILVEGDLFSYSILEYDEDFRVFAPSAAESIAEVKRNPWVRAETGGDDLLYMTAIPWVTFTSFKHPLLSVPAHSVPLMAWGKFFEQGTRVLMPLEVDGHHALMDGLHVGRYYEAVQAYLNTPESWLGD